MRRAAPRSVNEKYRVGPDLFDENEVKAAFPIGCAVASPKRPAGYGKLGIVTGYWRGAPWCLIVAGDRDLGIIACGELEKVLSKDEVDAKVPPPDSFTRQQVEAMLHVALTVRTDEWTSNSVDERVAILLAMFPKEKP
jgi:hypothetical protein